MEGKEKKVLKSIEKGALKPYDDQGKKFVRGRRRGAI